MTYWPWWLGALALSAVSVGHWLLLRRMLAVSGSVTAVVDRFRLGPVDDPEMTDAELLEALHAATAERFGPDASTEPSAPAETAAPPVIRRPVPLAIHLTFLGALAIGGALSALAAGWTPTSGLRAPAFASLVGGHPLVGALVLLGGGMLVGFGTRMAGGCSSGHGLSGASRLQPGSLVATAAFFGAGVAVSFLLRALS